MVRLFSKKFIKKQINLDVLLTIFLFFIPIAELYCAKISSVKKSEINQKASHVIEQNGNQNNEELFLRGNKYYKEGDYDKALEYYSAINKKGWAVLYNIGNCFFHKEDYSHALVYWLRAEKNATKQGYSLIKQNKEIALKKLNKQKKDECLEKMSTFFRLKFPYLSLFFLQLFFLMCWWLLILRMRVKQTSAKTVIQSLLCLSTFIFAIVLYERYIQNHTCSAIVVKKEAKLFAGPDKNFHVLSPVLYADCATVKAVREGWYKIQYADMIGWVEEDVIHIV